jgi:hypothetical protein
MYQEPLLNGTQISSFIFLTLLLLQYGCASYSKYPVEASLLDEPIRTTVDSSEARYYLSH